MHPNTVNKSGFNFLLNKNKYILLVIITGLGFIMCVYGRVLINPNQYLSKNYDDGMKNNYAFVTEIAGEGSVNQHSFNYPYGECFLYTDCHPFLSKILHYLNKIFPGIEHYSIGILNIFLIFNIFFTYIVLFLLLRRFIKKEWYALIWAFAIMMLQPQIERIGEHQSLSYSLAIPLVWYLTILYYDTSKRIKFTILLFIINIIWMGTHNYLGIITCGFCLMYDLFQICRFKKYRNLKDISFSLLRGALPIIIFLILMAFADTHYGRTENPFGFFEFRSSFAGIFIPNEGPLFHFIRDVIKLDYFRSIEGRSYIGIVSTLCIIILLFTVIYRLFVKYIRRKNLNTLPYKISLFAPAFFASLIFLFFSLGYPFKLGMEDLLDKMLFIKQFRATGRFAWPFFYVINVFSAYMIYSYATKLIDKRKLLAYIILLTSPAIVIMEGIPYQIKVHNKYFVAPNTFLKRNLSQDFKDALSVIDASRYQTVIPIPYFQGSDTFTRREYGNRILEEGPLFAYHLKLPFSASYFARSSIWESKNLMQMFSPDFYEKEIKKDFDPDKKFLIIMTDTSSALLEEELKLLEKSTPVFFSDDIKLFEIDYQTFLERKWKPYFDQFEEIKSDLIEYEDFLLSDSAKIVFMSFDDRKTEHTRLGQGSFMKNYEDWGTQVLEIPAGELKNGKYEISLWAYQCGDNFGQDMAGWELYVYNSGKTISRFSGKESLTIDGCWSFRNMFFEIEDENSPVSVLLARIWIDKPFYIDELLIRPVDVDVYRLLKDKNNKDILYNNGHIIKSE